MSMTANFLLTAVFFGLLALAYWRGFEDGRSERKVTRLFAQLDRLIARQNAAPPTDSQQERP